MVMLGAFLKKSGLVTLETLNQVLKTLLSSKSRDTQVE